jgi:Type II CAAX prenyl endopeptidase Rce1-like
MIDAMTTHTRLIDKFLAYLCVCYVATVLWVDHLGKFSLPANQYRFIFWFSVPVVFYLLTVYSAENRREILHWLDIRALSRKEWHAAIALMAGMVLVIAVIPLVPSLADYYKPGRISVGRRLIWLSAWFPGWELMHRCLLAYHIPRSLPPNAWLLIPLFEGVYHFNKPWPEMLGMFAWSGVLTFWTIKRKNACLAILAHLVLECLLIAYLGFGA